MCQQEQEQSLASILGENTDKMQLTRKILDLKQVGDSRQQTQKLLLNSQQASIITTGKQLDFFERICFIVQFSTIVYLYVSKCFWFKMQSERLRPSAYAHIGRHSLYLLTDVTDSLASLKPIETASCISRVGDISQKCGPSTWLKCALVKCKIIRAQEILCVWLSFRMSSCIIIFMKRSIIWPSDWKNRGRQKERPSQPAGNTSTKC